MRLVGYGSIILRLTQKYQLKGKHSYSLGLKWCQIGVRIREVTFKFVQWEGLGYLYNSTAK